MLPLVTLMASIDCAVAREFAAAVVAAVATVAVAMVVVAAASFSLRNFLNTFSPKRENSSTRFRFDSSISSEVGSCMMYSPDFRFCVFVFVCLLYTDRQSLVLN